MLLVLPVKDGKPYDWYRSEGHIVASIENGVVDECAREERQPSVDPQRDRFHEVLVEHIGNEEGVAAVGFSTMAE